MDYQLEKIPDGEAGTDATVKRMGELVQASLRRPTVRMKALEIYRRNRVPNKDVLTGSSALFEHVRRHVRYVRDPIDVETVQTPEATLQLAAGDCDDHTILLAALAASVGIRSRIRVGGTRRDRFQHVYPELLIDGQWVSADTTSQGRLGSRVAGFPVSKTYDFRGEPTMNIGLGTPPSGVALTRPALRQIMYRAALHRISHAWHTGAANMDDIDDLLARLKYTVAGGKFAEEPIRRALVHWKAHVKQNRLVSPKRSTQLTGLSGFFGSIWGGVKGAVGAVIPGGGAVIGAVEGFTTKGGDKGFGFDASGVPIDEKYHQARSKQIAGKRARYAREGHLPNFIPASPVYTYDSTGKLVPALSYIPPTMKTLPVAPAIPRQSAGVTFAPNVRVPSGLIQTQVSPDAARAGIAEMLKSPLVIVLAAVAVGSFFLLKK